MQRPAQTDGQGDRQTGPRTDRPSRCTWRTLQRQGEAKANLPLRSGTQGPSGVQKVAPL